MSILVNFLCRGSNQPVGKGFSFRLGRWLARRGKRVTLAPDARISPAALISPRQGAIAIGPRSLVSAGAVVQGNVTIGADSSVQNYTMIVGYGGPDPAGEGRIVIGDHVRIAGHCMIIGGNHIFDDPDRPIREQGIRPGTIRIEDDVWIGGSVNIMAGVTIGKGSVIGAGAVVTKDIPPMSVAVGSPARVIKSRTRTQGEQ